jgi:plasmid stabilization system protein ParE
MIKQIIWSPAAEKDAEQILDFINTKWSKRVAAKFLNKLDDNILLISEDPKLFPIIEDNLGVRKCVVTKQNSLFYRVSDETIEIIRLFDTRQNPKSLTF